ncbi:hypothetical protein [Methylocucumis oryzae]|uniref:Uncharacterized protein n=1 Tax=Methylocucumis oryzae TaxID=1632867 RepID=A0A0F3IHP0_9GAMM|nr:hypothetical protein [Methylocucumis oryzae]KJV04979.1 hypothetical protein VZ94_21515 [Methylocucumis oryzae]
MASTQTDNKSNNNKKSSKSGASQSSKKSSGGSQSASRKSSSKSNGNSRLENLPDWTSTAVSIAGAGLAVGLGLYATRKQWMPKIEEWQQRPFAAAHSDHETDYRNFDQTRNAGPQSMRDDPGEDWDKVDDMSDASFPASDPPSYTPGTA